MISCPARSAGFALPGTLNRPPPMSWQPGLVPLPTQTRPRMHWPLYAELYPAISAANITNGSNTPPARPNPWPAVLVCGLG